MHEFTTPTVYCKYTVTGNTMPYEDAAPSTISMELFEKIPNEGVFEVGVLNIIRIPSHKNEKRLSTRYLPADYDMGHAMDSIGDDLSLVADDMKLHGDFSCDGARLCLRNNDLYYVSLIEIKPEYRGKGTGTRVMRQLPKWLQTITQDIQPVIVLLPTPLDSTIEPNSAEWDAQVARLTHFYNGALYHNVEADNSNAGTKTLFYVPMPKTLYGEVE